MRLLLLLLACSWSALAHQFSVCRNQKDLLGIQSVDFQPDPPKSGSDVTVRVRGKTSVAVHPGTTLRVEIKVFGIVMDTEVMNVCDFTSCPLESGADFDVTVTQNIPEGTPAHVTATVKMTVLDSQQSVLTCLESSVEVAPADSSLLTGANPMQVLFSKWQHMFPHMRAHYETFAANFERIAKHNADKTQTFRMEMNEFGCMTLDEFTNTRMGLRSADSTKERSKDHVAKLYLRSDVSLADPPKEIDWVAKGFVTPVKNQGSCGSCWAFSTIGSLESAFAIKTGSLVSFSEQELVSCDTVDSACQGGLMDNAFDWIEHNIVGGLCKEEDYPYVSGTTGARGQCMKATCTPVEGSVPTSFVDIPPNEQALLAALATHGPVSVAIEADQSAFQFYHSGVLTGLCGSHLDHGVLLVGYGVDEETGLKFWKVKNSWGSGWGEQGYIRIMRGKRWIKGGECGIASAASYPVF